MAGKTDIANLVIADHSGDWVDDIDAAPGRMAEAIRTVWDPTLETALAAHPWKFARASWRDVPSVPAQDNPDPDRSYAYRLPSDCIRVFEVRPRGQFDEWGTFITSTAGPTLTLIGVRRGVDIGRFSAFFVNYLAKMIAYRICTPINASEAIRKRCQDDVEKAFTQAASDNGRAGVVRPVVRSTFLEARTRGAWH